MKTELNRQISLVTSKIKRDEANLDNERAWLAQLIREAMGMGIDLEGTKPNKGGDE